MPSGRARMPSPNSTRCTLHGLAQRIQRAQRTVHWRRHCRRAVTGDAMQRHQALDRSQALVGAFHHIVSRTAVNVNVDQPGSQHRVAEIEHPRIDWKANLLPGTDRCDNSILHHQGRVIDLLQRSKQLPCQQNYRQVETSCQRLRETIHKRSRYVHRRMSLRLRARLPNPD